MASNPSEILAAAMQLSESDRLLIAIKLMDTLPEGWSGHPEDEDAFFAELERRASEVGATVPLSDLWKQE